MMVLLQRHMASHATDDTKPLACSHCDKRFLNNSALACHLKIHSEEKTAYDCPICGDVFNQIVNLKEHVHVHCVNGNYQCPHCSKVMGLRQPFAGSMVRFAQCSSLFRGSLSIR